MTDDMADTNKLVEEKMRKLSEIRESSVEAYPYSYDKKDYASDLLERYGSLDKEEKTSKIASVAGRIVNLRRMGKATFLHLLDDSGKIQLYLRQDDIGTERYSLLKMLDLGDFIGAKGTIFKTKMGEVTVNVESYELLCKSIRPLPEKYHGLQDTELRYRKRHLDLIMNKESKETFKKRLLILQSVREFMMQRGFLEVETPMLQPQYGGAAARPFTTFHNDLTMNMYLRVSPELYLKRLIVGGFEKIFEINKNFRNEGIDSTHNPEFTMMEAYEAYADYNDMMDLMESLYDYVAKKVLGTTKVTFKGKTIDVGKPWKRITMLDAIKKYADVDVSTMTTEQLELLFKKRSIPFDKEKNWGNYVAALFEHFCEDKFINPTFVTNHPKETTPLCKAVRSDDKRLIERFEPFCMGMELGNAYSELNDPIEQRRLLEDQQRQLREGNAEANPLDEVFLDAIETGMPPTGGIGVGIDRLVMLLLGKESIRDVIFFPTMKPISSAQKESSGKERPDKKKDSKAVRS